MFLDVIDPRGIRILCTEECWQSHILDEHPEMAGEEHLVAEAIKAPYLFIYEDREFPERNIYYLRVPNKRYYIKVVVKFTDNSIGEVITAFKTDSAKAGERIIWPQ